MPYITKATRDELFVRPPKNAGELNYKITKLCSLYLCHQGKRYEHINAVVGVLECAKLEMYRRIAAPYENQKIEENGDVYPKKLLPED